MVQSEGREAGKGLNEVVAGQGGSVPGHWEGISKSATLIRTAAAENKCDACTCLE